MVLSLLVKRLTRRSYGTSFAPKSLWLLYCDRDNFLYMALPFVATSGLMTENSTLLQIAVTQAQAYYTALRCAASACQHIVQGSYQDTRIWAIGAKGCYIAVLVSDSAARQRMGNCRSAAQKSFTYVC